MASTYSTDLQLELVTTGEKAGLWGTITNTNLQILEQSATGYLSLDMAGSSVTLTLTDGATSNGKYIYLRLLKRGGKKGANWVNVVQEMYNNKIALKFATDKILKNFKGWTRKIYSMQRDVININSRYE